MAEGFTQEFQSQLAALLKRKIVLVRRLLGQTLSEREHVLKVEVKRVEESVEERRELFDELQDVATQLRNLVEPLLESPGERLSQMLDRRLPSGDSEALRSLVSELRESLVSLRMAAVAGGEETSFSLRVVNGLLSILTSSTFSVHRTYGPRGLLDEQLTPHSDRPSAIRTREV